MIAAAGLVGTGLSIGSSLLSQANNSDPERFAKAQAWYSAAIQGDTTALCMLKYMGGLRGCAPGGCAGAATCGFATAVAKQYTEIAYQQALKVLAGEAPMSTTLQAPPAAGAANQPAQPVIQAVSTAQTQQQQQAVLRGVTQWAPWVLAGAGVLVLAYLVMRARS